MKMVSFLIESTRARALQLPFVQRGLLEILILAVPAGLLGTWIVLRGLAFFSHAIGTAAFPGLILADGRAIARLSGELSFEVSDHDVVLRGRCERCAR